MPGRFSILLKILLSTGACLLGIVGFIVAYSTITARNQASESAQSIALYEARSIAARLDARLEIPMDTTRSLAQSLSAVQNEQTPIQFEREQVNVMLYELLNGNSDLVGLGTTWEPNAFDGQDALYVNGKAHDETGRFIPYWYRHPTEGFVLEPVVDYEVPGAGDWYLVPRRTHQESIIGPYIYNDIWMVTTSTPILAGNQFLGTVNFDVSLETVKDLFGESEVFKGNEELFLLSPNGLFAGASDDELAGQEILTTSPHAFFKENIQAVYDGREVIHRDGQYLYILTPFRVGYSGTPWSLGMTIPLSMVMAEANRVMWTQIGLSAGLILVALAILWFIANQLASPIRSITETTQAVAAGNLNIRAEVKTNDETFILAQNFNHMVEYLNNMLAREQEQRVNLEAYVKEIVSFTQEVGGGNLAVRLPVSDTQVSEDPLVILRRNLNVMTEGLQYAIQGIQRAAVDLNTATSEILAGATQQAAGASEQSATIMQTTTTFEEVKTISEQASLRAQEVANASRRTVDIALAGQKAVKDTIESMAQIKERVEDISENLLALSDQTQQIGDIIATVNDIASQSNLLALNASVEAARAGEHGKGFAVVAVEVRSLAEQSRQATALVKSILSEIQRATNTTVMATEEGIKGVERGVQLAAQARQAIEQLAGVINESAQIATQVVAGAQQQLSGVEQITQAMQNINQVTTQSLVSTRQTEKLAQNLNDLSRTMTDTVAQYKLN